MCYGLIRNTVESDLGMVILLDLMMEGVAGYLRSRTSWECAQ